MQHTTRALLKTCWYVVPALILWVIFFIPFLPYYILHIDESVYILDARTILSGGIPYRDIWDHKPPMIFFLFSLILKLFGGKNYVAINYVTLLYRLLATGLLFGIARRVMSNRAAAVLCLFYPVISNVLLARDAINPNTEIFMITYVLMAVIFTFRYLTTNSLKSIFLAGLSIGIATAFKQPAATFILPLCGVMGYRFLTRTIRPADLIRAAALFACGVLVVWGAFAAYFAINGALWEFWFQCIKFNFIYSGDKPKAHVWYGLLRIYRNSIADLPLFFVPYLLAIPTLLVTLFVRRISYRARLIVVFILLWHVGDLIAVSAGGLFYPHYFVQWVPSFLMVSGAGMWYLLAVLRRSRPLLTAWVVAIYCIIVLIPVSHRHISYRDVEDSQYIYYHPPWYNWQHLWYHYNRIGPNFVRYPYYRDPKLYYATLQAVKVIRAFVPHDKTLFIWGFIPELYLFSDRKPASRFVFTSFISGRFYGLQNLFLHPEYARYHQRLMGLLLSDLEHNKPPVIVISDTSRAAPSETFFRYVESRYTKLSVDLLYPVELYLRNDLKEKTGLIRTEKKKPHDQRDQPADTDQTTDK